MLVLYTKSQTGSTQAAWRDSYNALKADFVQMQRELVAMREKIALQEGLLNAYRADNDARKQRINALERRIREMEASLQDRDKRIEELERENETLHAELVALRKQIESQG